MFLLRDINKNGFSLPNVSFSLSFKSFVKPTSDFMSHEDLWRLWPTSYVLNNDGKKPHGFTLKQCKNSARFDYIFTIQLDWFTMFSYIEQTIVLQVIQ